MQIAKTTVTLPVLVLMALEQKRVVELEEDARAAYIRDSKPLKRRGVGQLFNLDPW